MQQKRGAGRSQEKKEMDDKSDGDVRDRRISELLGMLMDSLQIISILTNLTMDRHDEAQKVIDELKAQKRRIIDDNDYAS